MLKLGALETEAFLRATNIGDREAFLARVGQILDNQWLTNNGPLLQELEARIIWQAQEKSILKSYRALDGRGAGALALIDQLCCEAPVDLLCSLFDMSASPAQQDIG